MTKVVNRYIGIGLSVLVGIGVFLFWYVAYPHALSYQEQYQLFLWTGDYFWERVSLPGGFADWLGEFIVQFYYVEWIGALLLALVFVAFIWLVGWIPAALLLWLLGDPSVLLGYAVAIMIAVGVNKLNVFDGRKGLLSASYTGMASAGLFAGTAISSISLPAATVDSPDGFHARTILSESDDDACTDVDYSCCGGHRSCFTIIDEIG